jgi:hypothetical protein
MQHFAREAEPFSSGRFLVRPFGALGSCGFYPYSWDAQIVHANGRVHALRRTGLKPYRFRLDRAAYVLELSSGLFHSDFGPMPLEDAAVFTDSQALRFLTSGVWKQLLPSGELKE